MATHRTAESALEQGLQLRQCDPRALLPFATALQDHAGDDADLFAVADLLAAFGQLAAGDRAAADEALARGRTHFEQTDDLNGKVLGRGIQAGLWLRDGRRDEVLAATRAALALPEGSLSPWVRFIELQRLATVMEHLGRYDEALRAHYETIARARAIGDAALMASALGAAGGLQSSLLNLVDARTLCDEAWSLCGETDWHGVNHLVGVNRMIVLSGLALHEDAVAMAARLMAGDSQFPARHRTVRQCLYAMTLARAGGLVHAQDLLDQARAEQPDIAETNAAWVWIQAFVHNRNGRAADALALLTPYLTLHRDELLANEFPVNRAQLHSEAASACEALSQPVAALGHERQAAAAREQAAAQAAHAGRLTLQIDHELAAAHRARDDALLEQARAQSEQQRLAELNLALASANSAKTRFLAAASHDLRQPVQALAMYMAALQRERVAASRQALMARMQQSLTALAGMFDVLLDLSRLDAGLVPVQPAPLRLDALLRRLHDEHDLQARERGLGWRLHLPQGMRSANGLSDAGLLEICLRNLIGNAIKYTERGGVVLRLRAVPQAARWRIEVHDSGIGIADAAQSQVFHEFFQVGNDERDRSRGLGLGLSIVQRTAALLGHPLGLRSRLGRGSCFTIELPRLADEDADEMPPVAAGQPDGRCIAVIDDDAAVRDSLAALLQRWGHVVVQGADASDALAAWQQMGRPPVAAAIVDLRLRGERTGLEAIAALRRQLGADMPALVVTGDTAADRLRLLAEAGQPWLPKPLMPMRLRSWLASL